MPTATANRRRTSSSANRRSSSTRAKTSRRGKTTKSRSQARSRSGTSSRSPATRSRGMQPRGMAGARSRSRSAAARTSSAPRSKRSAQASRRSRSSASSRQASTTTDREEIRNWVEERGGHPATVRGTERDSEHAGLLRIDFPGFSGGETLEAIDWDEFFEKFEESNLAFLYDSKPGSRFNKFVSRRRAGASKAAAVSFRTQKNLSCRNGGRGATEKQD
jgi:hypothetical protein